MVKADRIRRGVGRRGPTPRLEAGVMSDDIIEGMGEIVK